MFKNKQHQIVALTWNYYRIIKKILRLRLKMLRKIVTFPQTFQTFFSSYFQKNVLKMKSVFVLAQTRSKFDLRTSQNIISVLTKSVSIFSKEVFSSETEKCLFTAKERNALYSNSSSSLLSLRRKKNFHNFWEKLRCAHTIRFKRYN